MYRTWEEMSGNRDVKRILGKETWYHDKVGTEVDMNASSKSHVTSNLPRPKRKHFMRGMFQPPPPHTGNSLLQSSSYPEQKVVDLLMLSGRQKRN